MTDDTLSAELLDAFQERHEAGSAVQLWLRDDDAIRPGDLLNHLLELTARYSIPLTLAVIPASTDDELAVCLDSTRHVLVAVHGWSHSNHAGPGEKKQELGEHRENAVVLAELSRGYEYLRKLHPTRFVPLLVPPWNRISKNLVEGLIGIGYQGLSTFGPEKKHDQQSGDSPASSVAGAASVAIVNTHVDLIDWKGTRGGRDRAALMHELIDVVRNGQAPVGILTHHLVHDDAVWSFLEELFALTQRCPHVSWAPVNEFMPV